LIPEFPLSWLGNQTRSWWARTDQRPLQKCGAATALVGLKFDRLLQDAGITAWKANQLVVLGGSPFFLDVVFRGVKLAVELDGRLYHSGSEVFETDRWRQNLLVLDGWCVLRFTSAMIDERPVEVMAMVREALEMLGAA
jgi:very-short-patch-repair endonuclease